MEPLKITLQKKWVQNLLAVLCTALVAYAMVYVDVRARAKEAFRRGERFSAWVENKDLKIEFFEKKFLKEKAKLQKRQDKGEMNEDAFTQDLDVLRFDRDQALQESSLKYAYQWYKDTYELFSPPESSWVRRARFLAPAAKQKWREELQSKRIPFEEYMLDLESGEGAGTLMVVSTQNRREAQKWIQLLGEKNIKASLYDAKAEGRLAQEGLKVIVPRKKFWDAHEILKPLILK